jgi:uncharacterized protein (TIGR04255 family)
MADYVYQNPPLIEVILEFHWELQTLGAIPDGLFDPHFQAFREEFTARMKRLGFSQIEELVPHEVPLELLGHKVTARFRSGPNAWPVYQIGPGVLTVNIVPPYDGWAAFVPIVRDGIGALWESYPIPDRYLKFAGMELRYLDAFTAAHGMDRPSTFIRDDLALSIPIPQVITRAATSKDDIEQGGEISVPLAAVKHTRGHIKFGRGTFANKPATIVQFSARAGKSYGVKSPDDVITWANQAHDVIRGWFEACVSDRVKLKFGEKKRIEVAQ